MGLLGAIFGFPLAPVRGVIAMGELIQRRVDEEMAGSASVRRELEEADRARAAGKISAGDEAEVQQQVLDRLARPRPDGADAGQDEEER